jgi:RNA polymerase primary sigma factor
MMKLAQGCGVIPHERSNPMAVVGPLSEANQAILHRLLKQVDKLPRLSALDELALIRRLRRGDEDARTMILESGLRGVVFIALPYARGDVPMDDLVQEGCVALVDGLEHFDAERGIRLMTFLSFRIRGRIMEFMWSRHGAVTPPRHRRQTIRLIMACDRKLRRDLGTEPGIADIAWALGLPEEQVAAVHAEARGPLSLDTLQEALSPDDVPDPNEERHREAQRQRVNAALSVLQPQQGLVVSLVFGLDGHVPLSLRQIGDLIDLTAYRVQMIQEEALASIGKILAPQSRKRTEGPAEPSRRSLRTAHLQFLRAVDFSGRSD